MKFSWIVNNVRDKDFMDIVNEAFEDVNFEAILDEDDEDVSALSEDSNYNSDQSEDEDEGIKSKVMCPEEIMTLNEQTKQCAIYFYYTTGGTSILCTSCMMRIVNIEHMCTIRQHVIKSHVAIDGNYCSDCRSPCFLIFSTNMCPICTN
ncbi:hypothetical protein ALC62_10872 [Cyphomyrmex costatus]|uniref:Uncharacterized protein n=1 Tax=Cyphomyrmex costatus TaxID=456900 RepID=A0A151IDT6_9HYME|nr:hypothetical protein ALC62_10872 [Cyphomyrmex costatus]